MTKHLVSVLLFSLFLFSCEESETRLVGPFDFKFEVNGVNIYPAERVTIPRVFPLEIRVTALSATHDENTQFKCEIILDDGAIYELEEDEITHAVNNIGGDILQTYSFELAEDNERVATSEHVGILIKTKNSEEIVLSEYLRLAFE